MNEQFTFFFKQESPFSQWYLRDFKVGGITFNCCEQYMMYSKAILFKDYDIAERILRSKSQRYQKSLGRKVKNFDQHIWQENSKKVVYTGNYHKFTQNEDLLKKLLETKGTTLVEASPYDKIWGIGLAAIDPRAKQRSTWKGKNQLGEVLTLLRNNLLKGDHGLVDINLITK